MSKLRAPIFILVALVAITTIAFACADEQEQTTAGENGDVDQGEATADTGGASGTDALEADEDERLDPYDTGGQAPEDVVYQYLSAIEEGNWERAHALQVEEGRPDLEIYREERESSEERVLEFSINQRRMLNTATAQVAVSTTVSRGGGASRIETEEWWTVTKEHGYWRIPMDPVE